MLMFFGAECFVRDVSTDEGRRVICYIHQKVVCLDVCLDCTMDVIKGRV